MKIKLIALGNVLMGDDGIAMAVADKLEEKLTGIPVEVISGETDIGYCMSMIREQDYLILLDAATMGKRTGEITEIPFQNYQMDGNSTTPHGLRITDYLKLCFPKQEGTVLSIEVSEVKFSTALSSEMENKISDISDDIFHFVMDKYKEVAAKRVAKGR